MKILVAVLLAVNIGMLLLISMQPDDAPLSGKTAANMPQLTLLDELSPQVADNQQQSSAESESDGKSKTREVLLEVSCYALGAFGTEKDAQAPAQTLKSLGLVTTVRFDTQREISGYWVYLAPLATRDDAKKAALVLEERGVKDFQIVPNGLKKNAISLGFFSTREAAEQRRTRMQAIGLTPILADTYRDIEGFWLHFSSPNHPPLPASIIEAIQAQSKGIAMQEQKCS